MGIAHPPIKSLSAIALAGCALAALSACFTACHKEKPAPPIDQLTEALQHTADQAITAPSLANEQIILTATSPGLIDYQAARVLKIASVCGGAGIRSLNAQGQTSILATIPVDNADAFKIGVRDENAFINPLSHPSHDTTLIEVLLIKPGATPTP